jgi:hypothetical protein
MVWKAPPGCPTDREALARIEALLGARLTEVLAEPLGARARVSTIAEGHYELLLETFQGDQRFTRTMQAATCAELADAGALVLALAIDPMLSERRAAAAAAPTDDPSETEAGDEPADSTSLPVVEKPRREPARTVTPQPRPASRPRPRAALRFPVVASATLDLGTVANVALGPELGLGVQWRALEASLGALWLPARRSFAAPGKGGDITFASARMSVCYRPLRGVFQALGCGVLEVGRLSGEGVGTTTRTSETGTWIAPGASLFLRRALGSRFFLSLVGGVQVPTQPIEFTLQNVGVVHAVPAVVPRAGLGLGGYFD